MKKKYTIEKNIQMLISLLKQYNIKKVITSPGAMNVSFIGSIQEDDFFELYSCVDERSACYMACGMAEESGEPVVLSCTGATSSRNYMPGLTEAFYRKLPIIAITSAKPLSDIGHNIPQVLDRTVPLNDIVKISVQVPSIYNSQDEWACNIAINKALLEINHKDKGPVHINLMTTFSQDYSVTELPNYKKINRYYVNDIFPDIKNKKVAIFVGAHSKWNTELVKEVELFCEKYNAIVLCDKTSNYFGKYKILGNLVCDQENYNSELKYFDLIIHLGNISGAYMNFVTTEVWRVSNDGKIVDTFKKLKNVFEMEEIDFFKKINENNFEKNTSFYDKWAMENQKLRDTINIDKIPFSNIWIANLLSKNIGQNDILHFGILNSLRSWNYTDNIDNLCYCNTGGFGIDGMISTLVGASLVDKNKQYIGIVGDLAFFYDMNALGNKNIGNNIRLLLINNGCGTEFHNYTHNAQILGDDVSKYVAADGHFGNKSPDLVKNYAENLGFVYYSASNKDEFIKNIDNFISNDSKKSIVFEVFTNSKDESDALKYIKNLKISKKEKLKNDIKKTMSPQLKNKIKKIIGA